MPASNLKIIEEAPPRDSRDGPREALVEAIAGAVEATAAAEAARVAVGRGRSILAASEAKLASATEGAARARDARAAAITEAAMRGGEPAVPATLREVRTRELEAQDEVHAARVSLAGLEAREAAAEGELAPLRARVKAAAHAVLAGGAEQLIARIVAANREIAVAQGALSAISFEWPPSELAKRAGRHVHQADYIGSTAQQNEVARARDAAKAQWRAAGEALMQDAGAPLPAEGEPK